MSSERPAKRIRQACEPCRRKKSRCPGEKPICSHCARLQQNCFYADERADNERVSVTPSPQVAQNHRPTTSVTDESRVEDRLRFLENQLSEVLANQTSLSRNSSVQVSSSPRRVVNHDVPDQRHPDKNLPPWNVIAGAAELYLQYCDCQPLPLFQRSNFIRTIASRRPEVLFSILAIALRFTEDQQSRNAHLKDINGYVEAARTIISKQVFDGTVELSTIQALCLLTIVDFTDGHTRRASIHCSLAMSLAHNAGLTSETSTTLPSSEIEERRRCFWSLFLVKRLHGADFMILDFSAEDNFPWYPSITSSPSPNPSSPNLPSQTQPQNSTNMQDQGQGPDKGIIAYAIQLSEVWFKITRYARRRGKPSSLPPWSSSSEYSLILAHQMDFETRMPYTHRFEPAKFSQRTLAHLNANRDYWGPWLFIQFLYHTNLCLLNHPLLLSLRLKNFKCVIPEIFLQHTSELIASHASWIINFIDMLESKEFKVTDPFLGHCVAIVATIYLQESFVDDLGTRSEKRHCFEKCLRFIRGFGEQWPHLERIASNLQSLAETVSSTYVASEEATRQNRKLLIDLGQFFSVLEYSSSSELHPSTQNPNHQLFGPSLQRHSGDGFGYGSGSGRASGSGSGSARKERGQMAQTQTSVLPQPTRVERQEFGNLTPTPGVTHVIESESELELTGVGVDGGFALNANTGAEVSIGGGFDAGPGVGSLPLVYSDDELAVLAESFFHQGQRGEFDAHGSMNGHAGANWWNHLSIDST